MSTFLGHLVVPSYGKQEVLTESQILFTTKVSRAPPTFL